MLTQSLLGLDDFTEVLLCRISRYGSNVGISFETDPLTDDSKVILRARSRRKRAAAAYRARSVRDATRDIIFFVLLPPTRPDD